MLSYLFPGQGSQAKGMGEALFREFPEEVRAADAILGYSVRELCLEDPGQRLGRTEFTQPALFVVNTLAYLARARAGGPKPDFLAGHSLGELCALHAAGAYGYETGLRIVQKRGELMSRAAKGAMAAVLRMPEDAIRRCLEEGGYSDVDIANFNSPQQIVISGLEPSIRAAQTAFLDAGAHYIPLNTSGAFHSRHMAAAAGEFRAFLDGCEIGEPAIPVLSNVTGRPHTGPEIAERLAEQLTQPVQWVRCMAYLFGQGVTEFAELGVGEVLTKLIKPNRDYFTVAAAATAAATRKSDETRIQRKSEVTVMIPVKPIPKNVENPYKPTVTLPILTNEKGTKAPVPSIEIWNAENPVGTAVRVMGREGVYATRLPAVLLFGSKPAIFLDGFRGYFDLAAVAPAREAA
jgi:malonyl CoA-acyl carrier protein transacylase